MTELLHPEKIIKADADMFDIIIFMRQTGNDDSYNIQISKFYFCKN